VGAQDDPFDLGRFLRGQEGTYDPALAELRNGRKDGHWIWFIFPQLAGLGMSPISQRYAISGLEEARAYLAHPVLGPRLRACCDALLVHGGRSTEAILGPVDARKVRSSMTLFLRADPAAQVFQRVLDAFHDGQADSRTDALLGE
jgi:uncharacterized protein (DUF1810 family)